MRKIIGFFHLLDLIFMMWTYAENSVKMIDTSLSIRHIHTVNTMWHMNILHVLSYIASLDMISFKIRHCHNNNITIQLHHQSDQFDLSDIICFKPLMPDLENLIFRITCNIMDHNIRVFQ